MNFKKIYFFYLINFFFCNWNYTSMNNSLAFNHWTSWRLDILYDFKFISTLYILGGAIAPPFGIFVQYIFFLCVTNKNLKFDICSFKFVSIKILECSPQPFKEDKLFRANGVLLWFTFSGINILQYLLSTLNSNSISNVTKNIDYLEYRNVNHILSQTGDIALEIFLYIFLKFELNIYFNICLNRN